MYKIRVVKDPLSCLRIYQDVRDFPVLGDDYYLILSDSFFLSSRSETSPTDVRTQNFTPSGPQFRHQTVNEWHGGVRSMNWRDSIQRREIFHLYFHRGWSHPTTLLIRITNSSTTMYRPYDIWELFVIDDENHDNHNERNNRNIFCNTSVSWIDGSIPSNKIEKNVDRLFYLYTD